MVQHVTLISPLGDSGSYRVRTIKVGVRTGAPEPGCWDSVPFLHLLFGGPGAESGFSELSYLLNWVSPFTERC